MYYYPYINLTLLLIIKTVSHFISCSMDGYANTGPPPPPPAPLIPSAQTAFATPPGGPLPPPGPITGAGGYAPPPPPVAGPLAAPPPPGPPPPPLPAGASHSITPKMASAPAEAPPVSDARSDLLAAIRMGKSCEHVDVCSYVLQLCKTIILLGTFKLKLTSKILLMFSKWVTTSIPTETCWKTRFRQCYFCHIYIFELVSLSHFIRIRIRDTSLIPRGNLVNWEKKTLNPNLSCQIESPESGKALLIF